MNLKKILTVIMLLSQIAAFSQFKLACVGNSITYGRGLTDRSTESYPAQIKGMLGSNWSVLNCAHSGATVLLKGNLPYLYQSEYISAKNFKPNVVVIQLGTNDSKSKNWVYKADFMTDYKALIDSFKALPSNPLIFICYPIPALSANYGITNSVILNEIIPDITLIASSEKVTIIDLYNTPFLNHSDWYQTDLIHPVTLGDFELAKFISTDLLKNGIVNPKLTVSSDTIYLNASSNNSASFTVTSNISWQLNRGQEWINTDKTSISKNDSVTFINNSAIIISADANNTSKERTGTITITGKGVSKTITVIQQGNNTSAVSEIEPDEYKIHPNPTQNQFSISGIKSTNATLSMYDIAGKLVLSKHVSAGKLISTNKLPAGVYSIIITDNNSIIKKKVIIT